MESTFHTLLVAMSDKPLAIIVSCQEKSLLKNYAQKKTISKQAYRSGAVLKTLSS